MKKIKQNSTFLLLNVIILHIVILLSAINAHSASYNNFEPWPDSLNKKDYIFTYPSNQRDPLKIININTFEVLTEKYEIRTLMEKYNRKNSPAGYFHNDSVRFVTIERGDIWRGEFNWSTGKKTNYKQVTQMGVFLDIEPLTWSGNNLFVWGGFDKEKPVVRINLVTGKVEEIDWLNFDPLGRGPKTQPYFITNKNVTVAIAQVGDWLELVDLNDGRKLKIPIDLSYIKNIGANSNNSMFQYRVSYAINSFEHASPLFQTSAVWLDENTIVGISEYGLMKLSLLSGSIEIQLFEKELFSAKFLYKIPGVNIVVLEKKMEGSKKDSSIIMQIDLETGSITEAPSFFTQHTSNSPRWLSSNFLLYFEYSGGLSNVGMWLYDRTLSISKKLTSFTNTFNYLLLHGEDKIIFTRLQDSNGMSSKSDGYIINIDGSNLQKITTDCYRINRVPTEIKSKKYYGSSSNQWSDRVDLSLLPMIDFGSIKISIIQTKSNSIKTDSSSLMSSELSIVNKTPSLIESSNKGNQKGLLSIIDLFKNEPTDIQDYAVKLYKDYYKKSSSHPYFFYVPEQLVIEKVKSVKLDRDKMLVEALKAKPLDPNHELTGRAKQNVEKLEQNYNNIKDGIYPKPSRTQSLYNPNYTKLIDSTKAFKYGYNQAQNSFLMDSLTSNGNNLTSKEKEKISIGHGNKVYFYLLSNEGRCSSKDALKLSNLLTTEMLLVKKQSNHNVRADSSDNKLSDAIEKAAKKVIGGFFKKK